MDLDAGQTLYALHEHQPLPPASTAKLMTALLVLSRVALTDTVQVSAGAAATGGSTMGLQSGEKLTVHDLLYGLLLPSGNDAAVALAEHVSGSQEAFVALMNQQAAQMGLAREPFRKRRRRGPARADRECRRSADPRACRSVLPGIRAHRGDAGGGCCRTAFG